MWIDACLSRCGAKPNKLDAMHMHRPGKAQLVRRPDLSWPFAERAVGKIIAIVARTIDARHERTILRNRNIVTEPLRDIDEELTALGAKHGDFHHQDSAPVGVSRDIAQIAGIGQAPSSFPTIEHFCCS